MAEGEVAGRGEQPGDPSTSHDAVAQRAKERVGTTLRDKWRLDVLLGVGGMAAVYAATHRNGSRAAVKVLHAGMSSNPFVRPRFLWEGYLANAVGHEGAVKVIDDDEAEDGSLFLVTELLDGETLEERRARLGGRLPSDEVLLATDQLLSVMVAAHAKGLIHRDLKPENLFLTRAGQIKVLDFGIAKLRELSASTGPGESGDMVGGTPAYMAPEQARGLSDAVDERSDLWACGATMFCLLAGRPVNEGTGSSEQLANAVSRPAPRIKSLVPDLDEPVARVVDRALEFSKEARWPSAAEMQEALREAYLEVSGYPIDEASKLTLAEDVPVRTWRREGSDPSTHPRAPTTERPVALSGGFTWRSLSQPVGKKAVAIGGAAMLGLLLVGSVRLLSGAAPERALANPVPQPVVEVAEVPAPRSAEVVKLPPTSEPAIAVSDLPVAPSSSRASARSPKAGATSAPAASSKPAAAAATSPAPSVRPECQPPYVVDVATGKKRWKLECL
jgi:serine/threonine-protein kinase